MQIFLVSHHLASFSSHFHLPAKTMIIASERLYLYLMWCIYIPSLTSKPRHRNTSATRVIVAGSEYAITTKRVKATHRSVVISETKVMSANWWQGKIFPQPLNRWVFHALFFDAPILLLTDPALIVGDTSHSS